MDLSVEIEVQWDIPEGYSASEFDPYLISQAEWEAWFVQWLQRLDPQLSPINTYGVGLCLTLDPQMQQFNAQFRHRDQPTDVLAFASLEREALPPQIWQSQPLELGDIIISLETAYRQSAEHQHSFKQEVAWLASHGLLHLLGWDHPTPTRLEEMLAQQDQLLQQVGLH